MKYSVNIGVNSLEKVEITSGDLMNLHNDSVLVWLGEESSNKLFDYYSAIKNMLVHGNRVILLLDGEKSRIRKQICMLLVSYQNYDIYQNEPGQEVDMSYVNILLERRPTVEEVETFISSDMAAYGQINEVLGKLSDLAGDGKFDEAKDLMVENTEILENAVNTMDYMKNLADSTLTSFNSVVNPLRANLREKEEALKSQTELVSSQRYTIQQKDSDIRDRDLDIKNLKDQLSKAGNSGNPAIINYTTLNLNVSLRTRVTSVIYFKEISKLKYINSFITELVTIINKIAKLKVKLLIYDRTANFNVYKPISCVDSRIYNTNPALFLDPTKNEKIVILDPAENILRDMITRFEGNVIIIYDRMREKEDLIAGAIVQKYYVVSSNNDYKMLRESSSGVSDDYIIGPSYVSEDIISIPDVTRAEVTGSSKKTATYFKLQNGGKHKFPLMTKILNNSNIALR